MNYKQNVVLLVLMSSLAMSGCANEPGKGWAQLQGAVHVALEESTDHPIENGVVETESGYAVSIETLELSIDTLEFTALSESAEAASETVLSVHLDAAVPLLAGGEFFIAPADCSNECQVSEKVELTGVRLNLLQLTASGTVRDLRIADAPEYPWRLRVPLAGDALSEAVEIPITGEQYEIKVAVHADVEPEIFEAIDWQQAATAETLSESSAAAVRAVLLESHLEVETNVEADHEDHGDESPEQEDDHGHAH
jgi:hypothetical protein